VGDRGSLEVAAKCSSKGKERSAGRNCGGQVVLSFWYACRIGTLSRSSIALCRAARLYVFGPWWLVGCSGFQC
jgi:hypothetical protein